MILNSIPYFRKYFDINKNFYLEVKNQSVFYINIILFYTLSGKKISKPYPVFAPKKTQRVGFPDEALDLEFDLYNCYFVPPHLICKNTIPCHESSCFKIITNQHGGTQCIPIAC